MNKTQLTAHIAQKCGVSKRVAAEILNCFVAAVIMGVKKNGEVRIQGFGTFKKSARKARVGVNPRKPSEKIQIPAMNVPTFKAGADFKKTIR